MNKTYFLALMISLALVLAACAPNPEVIKARVKREQQELQREADMEHMKATREAIFKEEAKFQDLCKTGRVEWIDSYGDRVSVNAVICEGIPVTSLQYQYGKFSHSSVQLGTLTEIDKGDASLSPEQEKEVEKMRQQLKEKIRANALGKLNEVEKKALGL